MSLLPESGFALVPILLPSPIREKVAQRDWKGLDQLIASETAQGGVIFEELKKWGEFASIEFIISIRSSESEPDDDGIWHDDGSRLFAFSLSLTLNPDKIEGGKLGIRSKKNPDATILIPTPPFGTMIIFKTGVQGFEHRIHRVTQGERIIIAGWCS